MKVENNDGNKIETYGGIESLNRKDMKIYHSVSKKLTARFAE